MSEQIDSGNGVTATATVVRGGNRQVKVSVPLVSRHPDGSVRYAIDAVAFVTIPAGDDVPTFEASEEPLTWETLP